MKPIIGAGEGTAESCWHSWAGLSTFAEIDAVSILALGKRLVVIAPHPDDEILMAGGLLQCLFESQTENPICKVVVAVTDGDASHPGSTKWPVERLQRERPRETTDALRSLQCGAVDVLRLGLPDGKLGANVDELHRGLSKTITSNDIVLATWALDGHPDHEVCGNVARAVAQQCGAAFVEVPVWMWHWATPDHDQIPWHRARRLLLTNKQIERKKLAMACFISQLYPDDATGQESIVPSTMLARAGRNFELFFI